MAVDQEALINMSLSEAKTAKWAAGHDKHRPPGGHSVFQGDPVLELHSEGLDAHNYTDELYNQALISFSEEIVLRSAAATIIAVTRDIYTRRKLNG